MAVIPAINLKVSVDRTKRVLCVASHPDDEAYGCGATLYKHARAGDEVRVLWMTDGASWREPTILAQGREALMVLGAKGFYRGRFTDQTLDRGPLINQTVKIESVVTRFRPDVVYTHSACDLNQDHVATHRATLIACRPHSQHSVKRVLAFEVPSSTEWGLSSFRPTCFVDVSGNALDAKIAACLEYEGEMRRFPHPRSPEALRALAAWRGASAGVHAAESFEVVREIA